MNFLSLFAGIGGFDLGLERAGMKCVGQVEIDPKCQLVLAKHWPHVKRIGDIRDVKGNEFGTVNLICGGFPCQPFSCAGKRKGKEDDRYLWPEMLRVIQAVGPSWVIGENVSGIIGVELDTVLSQLEGIGYEVQTLVIPACAVGAPHRRDRIWILSHTGQQSTWGEGNRFDHQQPHCHQAQQQSKICKDVANACGQGLERSKLSTNYVEKTCGRSESTTRTASERCSNVWEYWSTEPCVGRVAHGIPGRMDRLKQLGNAVVPQIPEIIGRYIMEIENNLAL